MNILPAIKTHLLNESINAPIKMSRVPDKPDQVIVLTDTGGVQPDANDTSIGARQHRTFQVYVRGSSYVETQAICKQIRAALINRVNVVIGTLVFQNIIAQNEFQSIGQDETGRNEFTANFSTMVLDTEATGNVPGGGSIDAGTPYSTYGGIINIDGGEV